MGRCEFTRRLWIILVVGGLFEMGWAVALGYSDGLNELIYVPPIVFFMAISMYLLGVAIDGGLPSGTAYAVWVGIGAVGTVVVSILLGNEIFEYTKAICVAAIVGGVLGLQMCSGKAKPSARD